MMECPNLQERFGTIYRVRVSDDHKAERGTVVKRLVDPWHWQIVGKYGHVCPWGPGLVAICLNGRRVVAKRLATDSRVISRQWGDDGINAVIAVDDLPDMIGLIAPYRRRHVSDAERDRLCHMRRLAALRGRELGPEIDANDPGRPGTP